MTPGETGGRRPLRVLVVDDEPDIETLIRQRFRRRNGYFEFAFARNGEEALERLSADPALEVVVTDINMPVMDGLELLARLESLGGRLVKAVILSAYGDLRNIRTAMNEGAFDFLMKPIDFQDFETTLIRTGHALDAARRGIEARERLAALEQELDIAARIQASMLPSEFLPGWAEFGIYGEMTPARRVGGDFYDFFMIGESRLGFMIGDVSGKGVPAALFMAVSRTLLRATALQGIEPGECLRYTNQTLRGQGDEGVFVTVFYGILDVRTGQLEYAIGGHNPPYLVSPRGPLRAIDEPGGVVIGLLPEGHYETGRLHLAAGDSIFLFTDGVTEAMNQEERFFGERRLKEMLADNVGAPPRRMVRAMLSAVTDFAAGALQSDDITALAVQWTPR